MKWDFSTTSKWKIDGSWSIEIQDGEIYSWENWLKQKLSIWSLSTNINIEGDEKKLEVKNMDIISNNEKVYLFIEKWFEKLSELWIKSPIITIIKNNIEENKYVLINNSKPIFEVLWNLWENELINQLVLWSVTLNPNEYYTNNWVYEKLRESLKNDEIINYMFTNWETNKTTWKIPLILNKNICNDYWPVILNLWKQLKKSVPINIDNYSNDQIIEMCNTSIIEINKILPNLLKIYREWDIQNWNFNIRKVN